MTTDPMTPERLADIETRRAGFDPDLDDAAREIRAAWAERDAARDLAASWESVACNIVVEARGDAVIGACPPDMIRDQGYDAVHALEDRAKKAEEERDHHKADVERVEAAIRTADADRGRITAHVEVYDAPTEDGRNGLRLVITAPSCDQKGLGEAIGKLLVGFLNGVYDHRAERFQAAAEKVAEHARIVGRTAERLGNARMLDHDYFDRQSMRYRESARKVAAHARRERAEFVDALTDESRQLHLAQCANDALRADLATARQHAEALERLIADLADEAPGEEEIERLEKVCEGATKPYSGRQDEPHITSAWQSRAELANPGGFTLTGDAGVFGFGQAVGYFGRREDRDFALAARTALPATLFVARQLATYARADEAGKADMRAFHLSAGPSMVRNAADRLRAGEIGPGSENESGGNEK